MADLRKHSSASNIFRVKLTKSSDGTAFTGATSASSGLKISTICDNEATATVYTAAGSTIETITTLGTFAAPTATKCRFKEVDATNHAGLYELQFADARFSVSSAKRMVITISGITGLFTADYEVQLTQVDVYDAARAGMTSLPDAVPGAANGIFIAGTNAATTVTSSFTTTFTGNLTGNIGGTLAGHTPQTGDSFARIGATGSGLTSIAPASTALSTVVWTNGRAAALDNLDVASSVLQSQITALNNLSAKANLFGSFLLEIPESGTRTYKYRLVVRDDEDKLADLDGSPTVTLVNAAGTDRSSDYSLSSVTDESTGEYTWTIAPTTSTVSESLTLKAAGTISGESRVAYLGLQAVDYDTATQINTILANLATAQSDLDVLTGPDGAILDSTQPNYAPNIVVPDAAGTAATLHATTDAAIDLVKLNTDYPDFSVHVSASGGAGTTVGTNGTIRNPANSIANALTIANSMGTAPGIKFAPGTALTASSGSLANRTIDVNSGALTVAAGVSLSAAWIFSSGKQGNLYGPSLGKVTVVTSTVLQNLYVSGIILSSAGLKMLHCGLSGDVTDSTGGPSASNRPFLSECYNVKGDGSAVTFNLSSGGHWNLMGWYGDLKITNMGAGQEFWANGWGKLTIDASCTGGIIKHTSHIEIVDEASGAVTRDLVSEASLVDLVDAPNATAIAAINAAVKAKTDLIPANFDTQWSNGYDIFVLGISPSVEALPIGRHSLASVVLQSTKADTTTNPGKLTSFLPTGAELFQFTITTAATDNLSGIS